MKTFDNMAAFLADGGDVKIQSRPAAAITIIAFRHRSWPSPIFNEVAEKAFAEQTNVLHSAFAKTMALLNR